MTIRYSFVFKDGEEVLQENVVCFYALSDILHFRKYSLTKHNLNNLESIKFYLTWELEAYKEYINYLHTKFSDWINEESSEEIIENKYVHVSCKANKSLLISILSFFRYIQEEPRIIGNFYRLNEINNQNKDINFILSHFVSVDRDRYVLPLRDYFTNSNHVIFSRDVTLIALHNFVNNNYPCISFIKDSENHGISVQKEMNGTTKGFWLNITNKIGLLTEPPKLTKDLITSFINLV